MSLCICFHVCLLAYPTMAFFGPFTNELKTYCPDRDEPADFDRSGNRPSRQRGISTNATRSGRWACRSGNVRRHVQLLSRQAFVGWLILPSNARQLPCVVETIGYGAGGISHLTGCCGPAQATLISSWTRADRAAAGRQETRPICTPTAATPMSRAA